jgi:hypothetical protein
MADDDRGAAAEPVRCELVERFSLGDEQCAVVLRRGYDARIVPAAVAEALETLVDLRPLHDHARAICDRLRRPERFDSVLAQLQEMRDAGLLSSRHDLLGATPGESKSSGARIETLAIPTCDRPGPLARAVATAAEHMRRHRLDCAIVVSDDARDPEARARCRLQLRELATATGARLGYAGRDERARFAQRLAEAANVDPEVLRYALLDNTEFSTIGSNRNAILLGLAGTAFCSMDDDVELVLATGADPEPGVAFTRREPFEFQFFPDRARLLAVARIVDANLVGAHETLLGASSAVSPRTSKEAWTRSTSPTRTPRRCGRSLPAAGASS